MPIEITIPRLGWNMDEGLFNGWLKKDGDPVKSGEPLFTLEAEKSAQEIESLDAGTLHIPKDCPQTGDTVKVGQIIGYLVQENEVFEPDATLTKQPPAQGEKPQKNAPKSGVPINPTTLVPAKETVAKTATTLMCSPRARRRAAELGVELNGLQGSGSTGRITETDVLKAAASRSDVATLAPASKPAQAVACQVSTMRRNIAERTALSFSQIPHFYLTAEVDATELVTMRQHLVDVLEKEHGVRITLTDFLLRAQAIALREFPSANAIWQNDGLLNYVDADVGVVVGLPEGLVIPVIRAAQNLSFVQLAKERARLVKAVRAGQFNTEMVAGGATSISNLGTGRTDEFSAIIAPHQSSMLAVGRAAPRPYVVDRRLEVRTTLRLCFSADHRVFDGGPAADFLGRIVELLENPKTLVDGV